MASRHPNNAWWLACNHHRTHRGNALDFDRHQWQVAIINDDADEIVGMKSVQCGVSEILILRALSDVDLAFRVFWILPDENIRDRFVAERVDSCLEVSAYYRRLVLLAKQRLRHQKTPADARALKQLGEAAIAFVGSNSPAKMTEFVADHIVIDELDKCDQQIIVHAEDRIGASDHRRQIKISNPTVEGFGIHSLYMDSDQKEWHIQCAGCREWQPIDWFVNVVRETAEDTYEMIDADKGIVCRKCGDTLDRYSSGKWVARAPGNTLSGYHVSQLFASNYLIAELFDKFVKSLRSEYERQRFWNSVLGIPYRATGAKLYDEILRRIVGTYPQANVGANCIAGADPGKDIHGVVMEKTRVVKIFRCEGDRKFDQLQEIMDNYRCVMGIDADYDTTAVKRFRDKNRGRVYMISYRTPRGVEDFVQDGHDRYYIKAARTQTMDLSHNAIVTGQVQLPRDAESVPGFFRQMCEPTRIEMRSASRDGGPKVRFVWTKTEKPDHWRHGFNYCEIIRRMRAGKGSGPRVMTAGQNRRRRG